MNKEENENIIKQLEEAQEYFTNVKIPNMGMIDNNKKITINGKDYINKRETKEE